MTAPEPSITLEEIDEHEAYAKQEIERFGAGGLVELDPRELLRLCATARRGVEAGAEIAQIRDALTGDDYASLPSDLPTVRMAHEIRADHDKFRNQVRDTCRRAETAEAALAELKESVSKNDGVGYFMSLAAKAQEETLHAKTAFAEAVRGEREAIELLRQAREYTTKYNAIRGPAARSFPDGIPENATQVQSGPRPTGES